MEQSAVQKLTSTLVAIYEALAQQFEDCEAAARTVDKELAAADQILTNSSQQAGDPEFVEDLVQLICRENPSTYKFSLSDNSVLIINLDWQDVDLLAATSEVKSKWDEYQNILSNSSSYKSVGSQRADAESADEEDMEDRLDDPSGDWNGDPLFTESILPPFFLPEDYDGTQPVFMTMLLGHPLRPVLLLPINTNPEKLLTPQDEDAWPIYGWPTNLIIWWEDSPDEEFNIAAERALERLGAEEVKVVEIDGAERVIYELPEEFSHTGVLPEDNPILEVFFEEEQNIDDDLSYVPSREEVLAEVKEANIPEDENLLEYDKSRGLQLVEYEEALGEEPIADDEFQKPELRLVEGVRYHRANRRLRPRTRWN